MRKRKYTFFLLAFIFFIGLHAYTNDMLEDILNPDEDYSHVFPRTIKMNGYFFGCDNEVSGPIDIIINNNPYESGFEFTVTSPLTTASIILDKNLQPQFSETSFPITIEKYVKKAGHDRRIYYRENSEKNRESIVLTLYQNGKEKKKRSFSCNRNTFPTDTIMMICHGLLLKEMKKDFMIDVISLEDALMVRMDLSYCYTEDPCSLSTNFDFPERINDAIRPDEPYHVYIMTLHGLLSLIIRSHWYFVYSEQFPYTFVAYWGGDGDRAETIYITESEIIGGNR